MTHRILLLALPLACAACSKPPQPHDPPAPQARVETPWDSLEAQKKKAQDVQKTVDAQAKAQAAAIDAQTQ
ncbi:hypothetical protein SAMN02800694_3548 [Luteibacter sp. UNCMF331Sha3.1]|jgi:hypothetical protein|uniref:hypothetical protein n=1 Tax=Luteibacter sp. UNCMF331Sha3.1 TaxID=1502760 RepID=UPI0008BFFC31|nr:hypothetical protein [Luteibacter sp. UNCMF331Sha3.1]SEN47377.1 hypothetical protein SAMN02800694_3548 [Luteibacter sp. UNCMF331Sha3.1]